MSSNKTAAPSFHNNGIFTRQVLKTEIYFVALTKSNLRLVFRAITTQAAQNNQKVQERLELRKKHNVRARGTEGREQRGIYIQRDRKNVYV